VDEVSSGGALLPFQLDFQQFERGAVTAAYKKSTFPQVEFSRGKGVFGGLRFHDLKIFVAKLCVRSRPRLEAADAVIDF